MPISLVNGHQDNENGDKDGHYHHEDEEGEPANRGVLGGYVGFGQV